MAAEDGQSESTPLPSKSSPGEEAASSVRESSETSFNFSVYCNVLIKTQEIEKDIAARVADTPFQSSNPNVWGVLTALSNRARKRQQGLNMFLQENVHFIGGLVEDYQFRIDSPFVSRDHCKIYRQTFASEDDALKSQPLVFLKDISSNGTFVNRTRYTRRDEAVQIHHGDIISFAGPLSHDISFSFMYREVLKSDVSSNGVLGKRKPAEELGCEIKRVKREVGISVDDFCSLQRSNAELRKKLEDRGVTMDKLLQNENRASMLHHHHHQIVSQKRGLSETTTTEIMDDSSRWGEAEAGNWLVGISDDGRKKGSDEEPSEEEEEEESMGSCPPESEKEEDEEDYNNFCDSISTSKIDYRDGDSEESGEEVVSELRKGRRHIFKYITDDERKFGFDSDGLLIIEEESATTEILLVKQDKDEEESMGSSPNSSLPRISSSVMTSSSSQTTTYFAAAAALNLNLKKKKKSMMSSVTSSHSLHSYFGGLTKKEDSKKKKKKKMMMMMSISSVMTPPSEHCCYYGLSMNSQKKKKKKKSMSSVRTNFQSVHCSSSSTHDDSYVESGEEVVSPDRLRRIIGGKHKQAVG